jgi:hypothetical protein
VTVARIHPEPRPIKPELIEIGDTIRITFKPYEGVTSELIGTVAERKDYGMQRHLHTAEGGRLLVWEPGKHEPVKITLLDRAPRTAETLDIFDNETGADIGEIRKRL